MFPLRASVNQECVRLIANKQGICWVGDHKAWGFVSDDAMCAACVRIVEKRIQDREGLDPNTLPAPLRVIHFPPPAQPIQSTDPYHKKGELNYCTACDMVRVRWKRWNAGLHKCYECANRTHHAKVKS